MQPTEPRVTSSIPLHTPPPLWHLSVGSASSEECMKLWREKLDSSQLNIKPLPFPLLLLSLATATLLLVGLVGVDLPLGILLEIHLQADIL